MPKGGKSIYDTYKFVAAISTLDHRQTLIYQINFENEEFKFSPKPINVIQAMHTHPVLRVRFSHHNPKYLISCGTDSDTIKLWDVSNTDNNEHEPMCSVVTKQSTNKDLVYSSDTDLFAVVA